MKRSRLSRSGSSRRVHRMRKVVDLAALASRREEQLRKVLDSLNHEKDKLESQKSKLYSEKEHAVAHLETQIGKIEQPFDKKISELDNKISALESKINDAEFKTKHAEETIHGKHALKEGRIETGTALKGILLSNNIHVHEMQMIKEPLKNGVVIVRNFEGFEAHDSSWVSYFAIYKDKIVGFHFTEKSEHAGDEATYWSWIGGRTLRDDNRVRVRKPHPWIPNKTEMRYPTFKEWRSLLEKKRPDSLAAIDLKDKKNRGILGSDWRIHLGED